MSGYAPVLPDESVQSILTRDDVMTAREVADLLKMPVSTIYHLARVVSCPPDGLAGRGGS